ncbi:DNA mismatch repair protein MutT [Enterovibrio norvegicus FF-33]|uniref:DNA mismatch repair protein MutT n=1 Tax=Enterovibrio norvegicus FF-454 TaxID=1185651 RepID=A0A1E5C9F9_9GAMM|nr:NUDIX domain-containing protein [Enterovibrio norvegicus]OEE62158.1 DNA mismatch repair protein MutT [Enterovibrio norvegicus FF-454]OEE65743.1 DNA mismatch repair protein MutT [Enterovibrio norvegicus FF-33]OEE84075.1 DNA mismatch repair protein MutT [Enterovibrio norvegicus FF-162]
MHPLRVSVRAVCYRDDTLLLAEHRDERGLWYILPGGGIQHNETLDIAFKRELLEETGGEADMGDVLFVREVIADKLDTTFLPQHLHQIELFVEATNFRDVATPSQPDKNQIGTIWMPLERLPSLLFFPKTMVEAFQTRQFDRIYQGHIM